MTRKVLCYVAEEFVDGFIQLPAHREGPWSDWGSPQFSVEDTILQSYKLCLKTSVLPNHGAANCDELSFGPAELI